MTNFPELSLLDRSSSNETKPELVCPGETQPISLAIHLSRMAAGFPACRTCQFRDLTQSLPAKISQWDDSNRQHNLQSLLRVEGIRGRYLNQLRRESIGALIRRILGLFVQQQSDDSNISVRILFGMDARPSSPDLSLGVMSELVRSGYEIFDTGTLTRPHFDWMMRSVRPDLGIYLTGGTLSESWNGLDVLTSELIPWSSPGLLDELAGGPVRSHARLSRRPGRSQSVVPDVSYANWLKDQMHGLRPFRMVVATTDTMIERHLVAAIEKTSLTCHFLSTERPSRMYEAIRERHADLGFVIHRDGRGCTLIDEVGESVSVEGLAKILSTSEEPGSYEVLFPEMSEAELIALHREDGRLIVGDGTGRFWLGEEAAACDALLTVAHTLQALSHSDRPVSHWMT